MSRLVRYSRYLSRFKTPHFPGCQHSTPPFSTTTVDYNKPSRLDPPPIRVALTESAGRGVFATRKIGVAFCSQECKENAKVFYEVETNADWLAFDDYCRNKGLKYPLLVKRLACMVISGAASAESLDILQPSNLSHEMVLEMEEGYGLLKRGFAMANISDEQMAFLTKKWYISVLARIRINAFRIELAVGSYEDLLSSASACIEAEAAVGNAVYMLPSLYNHDCDPNAHIVWIDNADAQLKALCDVEEDEELRICYIDVSMDHDARQSFLLQGFGFKCNCLRCSSGD
ncbi:HISTONE-LYSINE N-METHYLTRANSFERASE SMYD3 [Salix koriyanagi]|uniref:HISTONE-LYSINE N-METHYLTRANSFERASE SMYD3 n=1 Tax=Salix koriyanagi TaxID=2511006 RepID=A0A9Q0VEI3_9ROSI|nr:HISTONE-LYSINE N-METHYLTRANSFERASE SMYD3 [Salix koriyanagi]